MIRFRSMSLPVLIALGTIVLLAASRAGATPRATTEASPVACIATPMATPTAAHQGQVAAVTDMVTIRLTDDGFEPAHVETTNGHPLTIHLINTGTRPHTFRLAHFAIDVRLMPGASQTVTITQPDLGDYPYISDAPCDTSMRGTLTFYI